ncbi:MAG: two-component system response regulator DevR [Candidatus Aldehydirespiratoraceae bacterium]|jgi:two-component system response regulator DevR
MERETSGMPKKDNELISVALLDDHEIVRHGVAELVNAQSDMTVVGQAGTAAEMIRTVASTRPRVAVLDVRLVDDASNGIAVCRELRSAYPDTQCLILTSFDDDEALVDAALAGAAGFVLKQIRGGDLVKSIREIANGSRLLDAAETRMAMQRLRDSETGALAQLTAKERQVFDLISEGCSNREIGEQLFIAEKTVKNYVSSVLSKLGLVRRTEVAALGARLAERHRRKYD